MICLGEIDNSLLGIICRKCTEVAEVIVNAHPQVKRQWFLTLAPLKNFNKTVKSAFQ
jgi:hypothetical protein